MDIDRLIKNWHNKASEEDYFSKFVFEYLAFIAFLSKKKFRNEIKDRPVIQKLKQDNPTKTAYLRRIQNSEELKKTWEPIKREFDRVPFHHSNGRAWWNCSHLNLNQQTTEEKGKRKGVIHSLEDWENMVEFLYLVRNNLFHGQKDVEDERDKFAVEFGYKTLRELVELLLEEAEQQQVTTSNTPNMERSNSDFFA
jgi:hypothetical protein